MIVKQKSFKAPLFLLFALLSFGTGFVLVTATGDSTENRSKASGTDPYNLGAGAMCFIAPASNPLSCNHCQYGVGGDEAAVMGQSRNCAQAPTTPCDGNESLSINGGCHSRLEYMQIRARDWRCNGPISSNFICPYPVIELSEEDYDVFSGELPRCTPARRFANILCSED